MAYPEPIPVVKGKAAKELLEKLAAAEHAPKNHPCWNGSRETYRKLRPKSERA